MGAGQTLEVRVETFNLLNHFNWGNPATSLDAGTFGRITSQAGVHASCSLLSSTGF